MTVAQNWVEVCNQFRLEQGRMTIPVWMLAADGLGGLDALKRMGGLKVAPGRQELMLQYLIHLAAQQGGSDQPQPFIK